MNAIQRDKCYARRLARAGSLEALGIVRASRLDTVRPRSNAERVSAWRMRSGCPGFASAYVRPHQRKAVPDCPQPDGREIDPRDVVQSMPVSDHEQLAPPQATETGSSRTA